MITNMFYTFSLDKQNIIKYGLGLKNNVFTLNIPVENTTDTIPLKIEVNNINEFKSYYILSTISIFILLYVYHWFISMVDVNDNE